MASARKLNAGLRTSEVPNLRTNYLGKGRGRGSRGKNTDIAAAPSGATNEADKGENDNFSPAEGEGNYPASKEENKILDLLKKTCSQNLNNFVIELSPEDESAIVEQVLESISTGEDLKSLALAFYDWALSDPARTSCVASLCATLAKFEKDGVRFRSTLLAPLKTDFESRDRWRKEQQTRWLAFVCLLCDLYAMMKTASDGYITVLEEPVYSCLDQLLTDVEASDKQIEYGTLKLKQLGQILQSNKPSQMELLIEGLRTRFLGPGTTAVTRLLLLEIIELYASGWQFDEDTVKAYTELSKGNQEQA